MLGLRPTPIRSSIQKKPFYSQKGFSLIEILVVMVIVGVVLSFVVLSFGDFGAGRRLALTSKHFTDLLKLAHTKAIIGADTYGVHIDKSGYTFYRFDVPPHGGRGKWSRLSNNHIFKPSNFPNNTKVRLRGITRHQIPNVIITSDGTLTPFSLILATGKTSYQIKSDGSGAIKEVHDEGA